MENKYSAFQKRVIGLYVEHPEVKRIWDMLDSRRLFRRLTVEADSGDSPVNLFVMGKSRVGKSQMMKRYAKKNPGYVYVEEDGTEIDIVPVAYMELPATFTLKAFYNNVIEAVGAPKMAGNVADLKDRAFHLLNAQRVEMLIIDEMDYLLASTYVNKKTSMEIIKNVTNETGVCLVCVGTPVVEELRTLNDQHIGRYPPTTVPWFKECDESFFELLNSIEEQLVTEIPLGLGNKESAFPYLLHELSGGLVGWLKPILREAFNIVGVFAPIFDDFSVLKKINGDVLIEAREKVLGDLNNEAVNRFLSE